jgi:hypothetical protein
LKSSHQNESYALRSITKMIDKYGDGFMDAEYFSENINRQKSFGMHRFIVKTFATFEDGVILIYINSILKQKFFYSLCFLILKAYLFFLNEFMHGGNLAFHLERVHHFNEEYVKFSSAQIILAIEFLQQNHSVIL